MSLISVPERSGSGMPGGGSNPLLGLTAEVTEPNPFLVILERIVMVLALAAAVIGLLLLLRAMIKAAVRLIKYLSERFRSLASAASEDYVDESIDTREDNDAARLSVLDRLAQLRPIQLSSLPPRERIRHLYGRLRRTHAQWTDPQTARETLPSEAASLYEKARYSQHEISAEDAAGFADRIKRL